MRTSALALIVGLVAGSAGAQTPEPALEPLATTAAEPLLIESVARAADGGLVVSSVHHGAVWRLAADGALTPFGPRERQGLFGMAADPGRGVLWVAEGPTPADQQADGLASLLEIDRTTGALIRAWPAPAGDHAFGDVAVGPDGTVYVADTRAQQILVLRPEADALTVFLQLPARASPQGMAVSADGRWLIFSGYGSGLHRVELTGDLAPRAMAGENFLPLPAPEGVELRGLDGLVRSGDAVIAFQNGTRTPRVLRLVLAPDWSAVIRREVLVEGAPLGDPTTGFLEGGSVVFVSHSQWPAFGEDGRPTSPNPVGAVVSRLTLP